MTLETLTGYLHIWITQYMAGFCLLSIVIWAIGSYLYAKVWHRGARDLVLYFIAISVLAGILLVQPDRFVDSVLWTPITWFCFTMLLMMEVIWLSIMLEALARTLKEGAMRRSKPIPPQMHYRGYGARR